jgi:hypothetical protein
MPLDRSPFQGNVEPPYAFVLEQFRAEGRVTLFLELLPKAASLRRHGVLSFNVRRNRVVV